jgi:T5SS/PEP-CTERM-associated repeat protein
VEDSNPLNANNWTNGAAEAVAPGTADTANIGDAPEAVLGGFASWKELVLGNAESKTGTLSVGTGGNLTLSGTLTFGNATGAAGVLNIDGGGKVTINALNTPNCAATSTINLIDGTLTITAWADWGRNANGKAVFNQFGGTVTMKKGFQMGRDNNGIGIYNMSGGVLNGSSGDYFMVGRLGTSTGIFNLTDGTVNFGSKDVAIGGYDNNAGGKATKGYFNQSGGKVTADGNMQIGRYGTGVYTQTGGSLTCKNYFSIARYSGSSGTYTITGGSFSATTCGIILGEQGTGTLTVGGTGVVSVPVNGIYVGGNVSGAKGSLYLNGGRIITKNIAKGSGMVGTVAFNGGTLEAVADDALFLKNLGSILLDAGGVEIDSAGHDIGVSGCDFDEVVGARFVKAGEGTLTLAAMPSADTVAVDGGTLALSAGGDNASARLAHRWSFTSNLSDSITGKSGAITGTGTSYVTDGTSGSTALRLPGANNGKCYVNLGAKKLPSNSVTIEAWVTMRNIEDWVRVFLIQDGVTKSLSHSLAFISRTSDTGFDSAGISKYIGSALQKDVQYYVAIAISPDGKGGSVTRRYIKKVGDSNFLFKNEATNAAWTVSANMTTNSSDGHFWLGRSDYNNRDATADYDEVRVWNGTLDEAAIALSAAKGPDAAAEDIAEIAASGTSESRTLAIAPGASFDVGAGNTLRQSVLNAGGTLTGGSLVVTERVNATVGETMTVASGATLDLTGAEVALANPEALTRDGFLLAMSPSGGIVPSASRTLTGTLTGYRLFLTPTKARIGKAGLIITVK